MGLQRNAYFDEYFYKRYRSSLSTAGSKHNIVSASPGVLLLVGVTYIDVLGVLASE